VIPSTVETSKPARSADLASDVAVPLAQAGLTGLFVSGVVTFIVWRQDWRGDLVALFVGVALVVATVVWVLLLAQTRRMLWGVERLVRRDLDGDQVVGRPPPPRDRLLVLNAGQGQEQRAQLERAARVGQFRDFVAQLPMRGTSLRAWERELGRDVYVEFRDAMLRCGWARWRSDDQRQGWELTTSVDDILSRIS